MKVIGNILGFCAATIVLVACGGGGSSDNTPNEQEQISASPAKPESVSLSIGSITKLSESVHNPVYYEVGLRAAVTDSSGIVHLFYGGKELIHRYFESGEWVEEVIDNYPWAGTNATVAIDGNDMFHILYQSTYQPDPLFHTDPFIGANPSLTNNSPKIRYAYGTAGSWTVEATPIAYLALEDHLGQIAIDSENTPYVAYKDINGVKLARRSSSGWEFDYVSTSGTFTNARTTVSLVIDSFDSPHIFFRNDREHTIEYATKTEGTWNVETVVSFVFNQDLKFNTVAIDDDDTIHACYMADRDIHCMTNDSTGEWVDELVDVGVVSFPTMLLDPQGKKHVAYYDYAEGDLYMTYTTDVSGVWESASQLIATDGYAGQGQTAQPINLVISESGSPHIYFKKNRLFWIGESQLIEMIWNDGFWTENVLEEINPADVMAGEYSSIAISPNGSKHIAYVAAGEDGSGSIGSLYYATDESGSWVYEKPVSLVFFEFGHFDQVQPKIFVDDNEYVHIVTSGHSTLGSGTFYLSNTTGDWLLQLLPEEYLGYKYSITLDLEGIMHIAYITATTGGNIRPWQIRYASNESGEWVDELIYEYDDSTLLERDYVSASTESALAISTLDDGSVSIAFLRIYGADLEDRVMYATNRDGIWDVSPILDNREMPAVRMAYHSYTAWRIPSMAIGPDGSLHMAYKALECSSSCFPVGVKYSSNVGGQWVHKFVDLEVYVEESPFTFFSAEDPAITLDNDDVYVAYYHSAFEQVRLSKVSNCSIQSLVVETDMSTYRNSSVDYSIAASLDVTEDEIAISYFDNPRRSLRTSTISTDSFEENCINNASEWNVNSNESSTKDFIFENKGGGDQVVAAVSIYEGVEFLISSDQCSGRTLAPLDSCTVSVEFSASNLGQYWDAFAISVEGSSEGDSYTRTINLMAEVN